MSMLSRRLAEKTSQAALAAAIVATSTVASLPSSWEAGHSAVWLALIPVWTASLITVCLPEAAPQPTPVAPAAPQPEGQPNA